MFILNADKSRLTVLQKGLITSGSVNVYDVKFQFSPEWDGMDRWAVFKIGSERVSCVLDDTNQCKLPWECVRDNDIGKEIQVGVYGMVGTAVVLPTIWSSLGKLREGTRLGDSALPPSPTVAEQLLAEILAARDAAIAAAERAEAAAGLVPPDEGGGNETPDPGTDNENPDSGDNENPGSDTGNDENPDSESGDNIVTDEEMNDEFDKIFG